VAVETAIVVPDNDVIVAEGETKFEPETVAKLTLALVATDCGMEIVVLANAVPLADTTIFEPIIFPVEFARKLVVL
jgi:hypothetical protein